jgi:putative SOS response-associated peptidase YedK
MCGRFGLLHTWDEMFESYSLISPPLNLPPRFNIAPTQAIVAVTASGTADGNAATLFQWGLLPSWAKDVSIGAKMINARAETVAEKPAFRAAYRRRRCLIPASGFYEWQKQDGGPKQPFWIAAADGGLLTFAGLWENWLSPEGDELQTCTIITTAANDSLAAIHARMPVILAAADFDAWLDVGDETDTSAADALLRSAPDEVTTAWPVSTRVNNVRNDDARLVEPVDSVATEKPSDGEPAAASKSAGQGDLFSC